MEKKNKKVYSKSTKWQGMQTNSSLVVRASMFQFQFAIATFLFYCNNSIFTSSFVFHHFVCFFICLLFLAPVWFNTQTNKQIKKTTVSCSFCVARKNAVDLSIKMKWFSFIRHAFELSSELTFRVNYLPILRCICCCKVIKSDLLVTVRNLCGMCEANQQPFEILHYNVPMLQHTNTHVQCDMRLAAVSPTMKWLWSKMMRSSLFSRNLWN